ncbi:MAG: hypothetical protein IPG48_03570 [Saprospiraceae bacterium]|nr:hypothetical protein [Saprospiraceae bacterium]
MNLLFPHYTRWVSVIILSLWMITLTGQESYFGTSIVLDTIDKTYRAQKMNLSSNIRISESLISKR